MTRPMTADERLSAMIADALMDGGDLDEMTDILSAALSRSPSVEAALFARYRNRVVRLAISQARRHERQRMWSGPAGSEGERGEATVEARESAISLAPAPRSPEASRRAAAAALAAVGSALLDFPLPHGGRLRHATRGDVRRAAAFYSRQAGDMRAKATWLSRIAKRLDDDDRPVGDVLTEADVMRLREGEA